MITIDSDIAQQPLPAPAGITTPAEFAEALRLLMARRQLSYRALSEAARRLPPRGGDGPPHSLPRSTTSDILNGRRLPSQEKLETFLAVCGITGEEQQPWTAAWRRLAVPATASPHCRHTRTHLLLRTGATVVASVAATLLALWGAGSLERARTLGPQRLMVISRSWTHTAPDAKDATHLGEVGPGPRWFSCWTHGEWLADRGHFSDIWVRTDNDDGRKGLYISVDFVQHNDVGDLPPCT
ncbi:helix-turn-helix domain-containing protein [Streptomyces gamaensis]|uniref:Helix-turn-helix domain-containing protein n=1 Tax=Streptomyces gamaensis TaxID=1763542 RepID=A0ABW0YZQ1_9ACTN